MPVNKFGSSGGIEYDVVSRGSDIDMIQINNMYLRRDGTNKVSGELDMNGFRLTNLANGTSSLDAVTRQYADRFKIGKSGGEMTGDLIFKTANKPSILLGCNDLRGSGLFSILLGNNSNMLECRLARPLTLQTTNGLICRIGNTNAIAYDHNSVNIGKNLNMNNFYIKDVRDPVDDRDAANKFYVDTTVESVRN